MRDFYQTFPNWNALRSELSWTHYRRLLRVDNDKARKWYMDEAANQNWSSRALERQMRVCSTKQTDNPDRLSISCAKIIVGSYPQRSKANEFAGHALTGTSPG